jgi:xyloglucan:xyloglucosyl transferase
MNSEDIGVPYLNQQPMGVYSSIWNGDQWATQGGSVKLDWTMAPFVASYQGFSIDACQVQNANTTPCIANTSNWWEYVDYQMLASRQINDLKWVRDNWLTYNYCADRRRFKTQAPECARNPL